MESKYICKYGLFHDQPCIDNEPKSNNGWIYTAMSKYVLNTEYDTVDFYPLFKKCFNIYNTIYYIDRLPGKEYPPISRDEIIGMASMGQPIAEILDQYGWRMYKLDLSMIPLSDTIKTLWNIRKKHRNYFWQNEILDAYPVAMRLFWHDRYYIKKVSNMKPTVFEFIMFYLYAWAIIANGSSGEQNLLYLQLRDIGSYLYKFIPYKENLLEYFGAGHIFNRQN